jgi:hypothetical protein
MSRWRSASEIPAVAAMMKWLDLGTIRLMTAAWKPRVV